MFCFNYLKEVVKFREKRKSGFLFFFSLFMIDFLKFCENLFVVMLYNFGFEFER